jgi:hypothetical protein
MTPPQYPHFPPPHHQATPAFGRVHAPARRSTIDIVLTWIMSVVAVLVALGTFVYAFLSFEWFNSVSRMEFHCNPDMTDCTAARRASQGMMGGIVIAVSVGAAGMIIAAVRRWVMWIWPTLALGLNMIAVVIGVYLVLSASHPS